MIGARTAGVGAMLRVLLVATVFVLLSYAIVATSPEFAAYSLLGITAFAARLIAAVGGILGVLASRGMRGGARLAALLLVGLGPTVAYGLILIAFWASLGTGLMDVIIVTATRRALGAFVTDGILTVLGVVVGLGIAFFLYRD